MKKYILFVFLLVCFSTVAAQLTGKVVAVHDGDTFTLLTENNQTIKIRLHGIDAPELKQDYATVSKNFLSLRIFNKQVWVTTKGKDRYKRVIGIVYLFPSQSGLSVNEQLLETGLAWHFKKYDQNVDWAKLENAARRNKKGLWTLPNAIAPWEFRRMRK